MNFWHIDAFRIRSNLYCEMYHQVADYDGKIVDTLFMGSLFSKYGLLQYNDNFLWGNGYLFDELVVGIVL